MTHVPKLLPCAHCGSADVRLRTRADESVHTWYVECECCGIRTLAYPEESDYTDSLDAVTNAYTSIHDAVECAVKAWNTRANARADACDEKRMSSICIDSEGMKIKYYNKPDVDDIDVHSFTPSELTTLSKRITDCLVTRANKLFKAIHDELEAMHDDDDGDDGDNDG